MEISVGQNFPFRFQNVFVMNFGLFLLLPLFEYIACGKHFLVETQDSQSVEENATKHLSNELSAKSDEKIVNQVSTGCPKKSKHLKGQL